MINDLLKELESGPSYRFAEYPTLTHVIPGSGAGVYSIWDEARALIYVGVAGRNPAGRGLASRLRSHASGRRSGDQFCVYVADHYVMPDLDRAQVEAIRDGRVSMDGLVRERIHAAFVWSLAQGNQVSSRGIVPDRACSSHPVNFRRPIRRAPPTFTRMTEPKV